MEKLLESVANQAPALTILVVLVLAGLKILVKFIEGRDEFIKMLHTEHIQAREQSRQAIDNNAKATSANTVALQSLQDVIESRLKA